MLTTIPALDGILVWSDCPGEGRTTRIFSHQAGFVATFFNEGDREDRCYIGSIRHLWRMSVARRNMTPEEAMEALHKHAADIYAQQKEQARENPKHRDF